MPDRYGLCRAEQTSIACDAVKRRSVKSAHLLVSAPTWPGWPDMAALAQHGWTCMAQHGAWLGMDWHALGSAGPAWPGIPRWWTKLLGKPRLDQ